MKIKAHQLAPYLPYGLKAKFQKTQDRKCRKYVIGTIGAMYCEKNGDVSITCFDTVNAAPYTFKPILRPMTDLTKEELIEQGFTSYIDYLTHEKRTPLEAPYNKVQYLLSKHYDVFGLIEQGLAIDINTIIK